MYIIFVNCKKVDYDYVWDSLSIQRKDIFERGNRLCLVRESLRENAR